MSAQWSFKELGRGDKIREPIQGEFFSTDAIRNPAEAIVRESIQNSLDASRQRPVRVRFFLSGEQAALPPARAQRYFEEAWPHYRAAGNGLRDCPNPTESCRFLVCEDFNTRGLQGDPAEWTPPDEKNNFFYFFRAEGRSAKGEHDRGRWGVGKYVFPRASRVKSFVALTVRADDGRRLLMGQAILKSHRIGGAHYQSDGWFAMMNRGLPLPVEEPGLIEDFCADFKLSRTDQAGLSVVVPWYEEEIQISHVLEAASRDYFHAILQGDVIVEIESPERKYVLTADTLAEVVKEQDNEASRALQQSIALAQWAIDLSPSGIQPLKLTSPGRSPKWPEQVFTVDEAAAFQARFRAGERLAFRVPLEVRKKGAPDVESYFDVFLVQDGNEDSGRPIFIREGIIVSDVRAPRTRGTRALVVIQDSPLATLLGDSENPAHTQWQKDSSNYKGKYVYGPAYIEFVRRSVLEITQAIVETENEADPGILTDYFSVPIPGSDDSEHVAGGAEPKPRTGTPRPGPVGPGPGGRPKRFRINRVAGGFSVRPGDEGAPLPRQLDIRAAYDVRRGNALARYRPEDFRLYEPPISIQVRGALIIDRGDNRMVIAIHEKDFSIDVTGFDANRDLFLRASVRGDSSDPKV